MTDTPNKLVVIDGETLMDARPEPTKFCIDTLLPQGLCILGGAPKIGKSWLVLDICVRVAKGEPVWGFQTTKGSVLYLCLEDSLSRISGRLANITDEASDNVFFAIKAEKINLLLPCTAVFLKRTSFWATATAFKISVTFSKNMHPTMASRTQEYL